MNGKINTSDVSRLGVKNALCVVTLMAFGGFFSYFFNSYIYVFIAFILVFIVSVYFFYLINKKLEAIPCPDCCGTLDVMEERKTSDGSLMFVCNKCGSKYESDYVPHSAF
ncbi:hypothetical protein [Rubritalea marina]|uniref:hypothetical protein n=1 Tax=Rubritalea marina TaxID=361055 RepID=UPI0012EAAB97|nr:hypothetical protein [Rubritalea marina]